MWDAEHETQIRKKFYTLSYTLKDLHQKGYFLEAMEEPLTFDTFLTTIHKLDPAERQLEVKRNLKDFSILAIGEFAGASDYIGKKDSAARKNFGELFGYYANSIPPRDRPYFQKMIEETPLLYYHDYVDYYEKMQKGGEVTGTSETRTLVKATPQGKGYDQEGIDQNLGNAAFAKILWLPTIAVLASLLMSLLYFIGKLPH